MIQFKFKNVSINYSDLCLWTPVCRLFVVSMIKCY
nr:MAG TPA: hypothetical protein [Caudoviricetes sp.]